MKKNIFISFATGFLFALGLGVSQMMNPYKVLSFLDITRDWDPSLLFVMLSAVFINIIFFRLILGRATPLFSEKFSLPLKKNVDMKLILGSALFGIGWGLGGLCPGPAIANFFTFNKDILLFLLFMVIGMLLFQFTMEPKK